MALGVLTKFSHFPVFCLESVPYVSRWIAVFFSWPIAPVKLRHLEIFYFKFSFRSCFFVFSRFKLSGDPDWKVERCQLVDDTNDGFRIRRDLKRVRMMSTINNKKSTASLCFALCKPHRSTFAHVRLDSNAMDGRSPVQQVPDQSHILRSLVALDQNGN